MSGDPLAKIPDGRADREQPAAVCGHAVTHALNDTLAAAYGPNVLRDRHGTAAPYFLVGDPRDYVAGIAVAVRIASLAASKVGRFVRCARSEGHSWDDLADALGVPTWPDTTATRGELAFAELVRMTTGRDPDRWSQVVWTCLHCRGEVHDSGPGLWGGDPARTQQGHAPDCGRHNVEVTTWCTTHPGHRPHPEHPCATTDGEDAAR